jgi:hypothetical protein
LAGAIALVAAAAGALFPTTARAEEWSGGAGVFVGYAFGQHQGFEWGFEGFATMVTQGGGVCSNQERWGIGPLAQLSLIGLSNTRLTLAALGGKQLSRKSLTSLTGEFGMTYRFGDDPGPGIHLGLSPSFFIVNAYGRAEILLDDYSFGGGLRILPPFGVSNSFCVTGRPLRTDMGPARIHEQGKRLGLPRVASRADAKRQLAGRAWERDAQYECASVPAFLDLARALLACDAPHALVRSALRAACDEIVHAWICANIASLCLGEAIVPTLPDAPPRAPATGPNGLVRLAVESWLDGCLGEGASALQAARTSQLADGALRSKCSRIATDEARHAELAWSILSWAADCGGETVREALREYRNVDVPDAPQQSAPPDLERFGRLSSRAANTIIEQNAIESRRRLDRVLSSASAAAHPA